MIWRTETWIAGDDWIMDEVYFSLADSIERFLSSEDSMERRYAQRTRSDSERRIISSDREVGMLEGGYGRTFWLDCGVGSDNGCDF